MRHRASRSIFTRLHLPSLHLSALARLMPEPGRRRVVAAAVLAVSAALTGVAVQGGDPEPSAADGPVSAGLGTPSLAAPPSVTHEPSHPVSRGGDRTPQVSPTTSTSPTQSETSSALPELTATPDVGTATATKLPKAPSPSAPSSSAPSGSAPAPADETAPDTSASTTAVDGDSWTVAVSADEPASFECSLDGGSYQACGGTTTYSNLAHGRHRLTARATDEAGNTDASPAQLTTTVNGGS